MTKRTQTQTCHPEFISGSNDKQIPNQVRNDNYASLVKRLAFTLAEVLITLAIIGVVAALTIPALLSNTNEKGLNTSDSVFQRRLGEALKVMNLQGTLAGHETTQEFVDELGKHIKIMKTCGEHNNTPLTNCFVSEFKAGEETIEVKYLKKSKNLNKDDDYGTETIGVVFGNGTRALIAYNPKATQDQFNNSNIGNAPVKLTTTGTGKQVKVSLGTDSLSILYNLQERKDNNVYNTGNTGNIRGLNISLNIDAGCLADKDAVGSCIKEVADSSTFTKDGIINCKNSSDPNYSYCNGAGSYSTDYWATAKKYCADKGLTLISRSQLGALADYLYGASGTGEGGNTLNTGGGSLQTDKASAISSLFTPSFYVWSSSKYNSNNAYSRYFDSSFSYNSSGYSRGDSSLLAVCVGN